MHVLVSYSDRLVRETGMSLCLLEGTVHAQGTHGA